LIDTENYQRYIVHFIRNNRIPSTCVTTRRTSFSIRYTTFSCKKLDPIHDDELPISVVVSEHVPP